MAPALLTCGQTMSKIRSPEDKYSDLEKHCFKLTIQINALLKNLTEVSINKYKELLGLEPDIL